MLINAQHITYQTPHHALLFSGLNFTLQKGEKAAITGNNGTGKSTLLRIIAGQEKNYTGDLRVAGSIYYVPQHYGHFNHLTVADALGIAPLLNALQAIENGATDQHYYDLLEHHWDISARCEEAFARWGITGITPDQPLQQLSGGMKTRLFLSGIDIFEPDIVLLDEPTNHLDTAARQRLYEWMENTSCTLLLTSHDRQLLRLCEPVWELQPDGIRAYGGNYDFYAAQKTAENAAREHKLAHHQKALKEAKQKQQQTLERKQHADAQARKSSRRGGEPKIMQNIWKNAAESSTGKLKEVHSARVNELRADLQEAAAMVQLQRIMKGYFGNPALPKGKVLIQATDINHAYGNSAPLWPQPLTLTIRSGARLAVAGGNGSGKSTLFSILQGKISPAQGDIQIAPCTTLLLDQDYSLIDREKTVLEQALSFNETRLETAAVHTLLANFLFTPESWNKPCAVLSGGEMLRLALCCMVLQNKTPDIIFLDEPVNNLDLSNIQMLAKIFAEYSGTLLVISHDTGFLEEAGVRETLQLLS
ncbi:ABC-F family ATP-binding cassette domain-containing protein [Chitinophaga cymbidii]|uniref:ABC transporter ATP-binding protein n=1 Tax=Chitinophaga cymbidii TaxID=1096750 RepID=A0A512RSX4_9BACT|nr:ABC-F family ATP-binding cassette domain-containing protein [Chitinophaga cymbidii]GEP98793.1 ABC transporter ATP-binding protein [Chitinophaga cymbidii]